MNRERAFGIAGNALDIAQDLSGHAMLRNPETLRPEITREDLLDELKISHAAFVKATGEAYGLYSKIIEWAQEYPLEKE